jgi:hypothetical protein
MFLYEIFHSTQFIHNYHTSIIIHFPKREIIDNKKEGLLFQAFDFFQVAYPAIHCKFNIFIR